MAALITADEERATIRVRRAELFHLLAGCLVILAGLVLLLVASEDGPQLKSKASRTAVER